MSVRLCPSMSGRRFSYVQTKSEKLAISRSRCDVKGKELNKTAFAKTDAESYEKRDGNGKEKRHKKHDFVSYNPLPYTVFAIWINMEIKQMAKRNRFKTT